MEHFTIEKINELLAESRKRPSYIVSVLEFMLGREPTQEEIDAVKHDRELERLARKKWEAAQPWPNRYKFSKKARLENIMMKRYGVPFRLLQAYVDEVQPDEWDY